MGKGPVVSCSGDIAQLIASLVPSEANSNVNYLKENGHAPRYADPDPLQKREELYREQSQKIELLLGILWTCGGAHSNLLQKIVVDARIGGELGMERAREQSTFPYEHGSAAVLRQDSYACAGP